MISRDKVYLDKQQQNACLDKTRSNFEKLYQSISMCVWTSMYKILLKALVLGFRDSRISENSVDAKWQCSKLFVLKLKHNSMTVRLTDLNDPLLIFVF